MQPSPRDDGVNPLTTGNNWNILVRPGPQGPPHTFADEMILFTINSTSMES